MHSPEAEFQTCGFWSGSELFLPAPTAIRLTQRYREQGIAVLGIDGFLIDDDGIRPQLDHILDLSGLSAATWDEAIAFLSARLSTPLMFVVVPDRD